MPRVFPDRGLTFQQRLEDDKLMFKAVDNTSRQLCVKFVYRQYGEEPHRMLSQNKMAPELFDVSRIDGGPTMVVMEMLDNSWQTLFDFAQKEARWKNPSVKSTIRKRLNEIVTKLEEGGFVHGDFRANNIMIRSGEEESAMLIDFDWAGEDGKVHYPLFRNHTRIQWPAEVASAIRLGHDRSMLGTQWTLLLHGS
jgi:thiamine kinase-like enzyme